MFLEPSSGLSLASKTPIMGKTVVYVQQIVNKTLHKEGLPLKFIK